ncbi:hypothetical protein GGTG_07385 [Gaeumannomyces tritici R3-111a-1]|uniref:Uncharacterized protein n=1 Tax=Gaeumannomyces tritici (strain R3-111a-1) TaxID=644352 RepID=J3P1I7_GAET3|nr:hypothetical protein GGTG_07385 [Gaeumannomyces tritici R3-111a-1]EJT77473.1 hypothetical protein GGTG_07385 [Gaeumannomyces tritici R3-111a-1]
MVLNASRAFVRYCVILLNAFSFFVPISKCAPKIKAFYVLKKIKHKRKALYFKNVFNFGLNKNRLEFRELLINIYSASGFFKRIAVLLKNYLSFYYGSLKVAGLIIVANKRDRHGISIYCLLCNNMLYNLNFRSYCYYLTVKAGDKNLKKEKVRSLSHFRNLNLRSYSHYRSAQIKTNKLQLLK